MSNDRKISGTVSVSSDSGSRERVAFDLATRIANKESLSGQQNYRQALLDLYAECLSATSGYRPFNQ